MYRLALACNEKILGRDHMETIKLVSSIALLLTDVGEIPEAEIMHRRAMESYEQVIGDEHPLTVDEVISGLGIKADVMVLYDMPTSH
jgi:Tetratricopeptide repeat